MQTSSAREDYPNKEPPVPMSPASAVQRQAGLGVASPRSAEGACTCSTLRGLEPLRGTFCRRSSCSSGYFSGTVLVRYVRPLKDSKDVIGTAASDSKPTFNH